MRIHSFFIGLLLLSAACSTDSRKTANGHEYKMIREGAGELVKPGQYLMINMVLKDASDSVWNDSRRQEIPTLFPVRESAASDGALEEVFAMLRSGDSVAFDVGAKSLFEQHGGSVPDDVDPESNFTFLVGVKDILTEVQMRALEQEIMGKMNSRQVAVDTQIIDEYLAHEKIEAQTTPSGLRYKFSREGSGAKAAPGNQVSIHYAGYLLDGTLFDTSMESVAKATGSHTPGRTYDPLTLQAGSGQVIPGWEEAILLMNKGSKMRVWIPSSLAYGNQRRSDLIVENSILVFDMEMVDIKNKAE